MSWTPQQQLAIDTVDRNLIVSAGAGSGKTSTMVARALALILEGVDVSRITMLTFTDAAAMEMKDRFRKELSKQLVGETDKARRDHILSQIDALPYAQISTIHSFCYSLVREFFERVPTSPSVRILDEESGKRLQAKAFQKTLAKMEERPEFEAMRAKVALRQDDDLWSLVEALYERMIVQPERENWLGTTVGNTFAVDVEETNACKYLVERVVHYARYVCSTCRLLVTQDLQAGGKDPVGNDAFKILEERFRPFEACTTLRECMDAFESLCEDKRRINKSKSPRAAKIGELQDIGDKMVKKTMLSIAECGTYQEIYDRHFALRTFVGVLVDLVLVFDDFYTKIKAEAGVVDFADMEKYTIQLLGDPALAEEIRSRRDYVFVDEYQDVNEVQDRIINLISPPDRLFMVGDSKQSIYRFRQADPTIFLRRQDALAATGQAVSLQDNFRSDQRILQFVNRLFGSIMSREFGGVNYTEEAAFRIRPECPQGEEGCVRICLKAPEAVERTKPQGLYNIRQDRGLVKVVGEEEAKVIAAYIQEMVGKEITVKGVTRPLTYSDIAILFRDRRGSATTILKTLTSMGIPVSADSFENGLGQREVELLFHYARLLDNGRQDYPLLTVMRSAFGGFSDDELAVIRLSAPPFAPYWQAVEEYAQGDTPLAERVAAFLQGVAGYRFASSFTPLPELFLSIVYESGFADRLLTLPDGEDRLAVLRTYIQGMEGKYYADDLSAFADYCLEVDVTKLDLKRPTGSGGVAVMTVHHSKGLEYPVVIVADCASAVSARGGNGPTVVADRDLGVGTKYYDASTRTIYKTLVMLAIEAKRKAEQREDLLRLMYVATTRAQNYLLLTGSPASACTLPETGESFASWIAYVQALDPTFATYNWSPDEETQLVSPQETLPAPSDASDWQEVLDYAYPYDKAVALSPKYTVTSINAAQAEGEPPVPALFEDEEQRTTGTDYHLVLEHIDLTAEREEEVAAQLAEMVEEGILTQEEADKVDAQEIADVLSLPLMQRLARGKVWRERRFVMPTVATTVGLDCEEKILVQGTVDLIAEVDGKLILVDYKHSRRSTPALQEAYRTQIDLYAQAVQSAFGREVSEKYLVEITQKRVIPM